MAKLYHAVVCFMVLALPAAAETPLQRLDLAARTAAFARANADPLALIVAAGLRKSVSERLVERQPEHEGAGAAFADFTDIGDTTASLAAEAVAMSGDDPVIKALAADLAAAAGKGLATGVAASRSTVPAGGADWYRGLQFEGGRRAETQIEVFGTDASLGVCLQYRFRVAAVVGDDERVVHGAAEQAEPARNGQGQLCEHEASGRDPEQFESQ